MSLDLGTARPHIASFVIVRREGKVAFVLRENVSWMANHYGLPSGKVEKDESYSVAAIREAKEEIGIDVDLKDLKFIHAMHRLEGNDWVDVYFEAMSWKGEPYNAEPHVHSELAWLDPSQLPKNTIPSVRAAIKSIEAEEIYSEYGWAS